ncbi:optic atrophy 3 protein (OPA3) domain-containing protein [Phthorimaea operculella]|nr:optic atrophy 3 protein (OPA3) domain-containing protein [Phthorimaea operculella]
MVVGAFPIAKLSVLLIKQISKPIANMCKERAKNSPFFRTYVCMPPAQFYNWCEVKAKMWILNLGRPVNIPVLSQEMAIELGANLLGESVIFIIGAGLLIVEYNRQANKEAAKEAKKAEEMNHITSTITDLYFTVQQQQTQLREMERIIYSISGQKPTTPAPVIKEPKLPNPKEPSDEPSKPATKQTSQPVAASPATPQNLNNPSSQDPKPSATMMPYPNKGIILQSLNYIQMDAFSSIFNNKYNQKVYDDTDNKSSTNQRRNPAIVSEALHNIENNFRSLF